MSASTSGWKACVGGMRYRPLSTPSLEPSNASVKKHSLNSTHPIAYMHSDAWHSLRYNHPHTTYPHVSTLVDTVAHVQINHFWCAVLKRDAEGWMW